LSGSIGGHALIAGAAGIDVPTMRLDTWVRTLGVDMDAVSFVKVDTQGHEAHVLAGAPDLLTRPASSGNSSFRHGICRKPAASRRR